MLQPQMVISGRINTVTSQHTFKMFTSHASRYSQFRSKQMGFNAQTTSQVTLKQAKTRGRWNRRRRRRKEGDIKRTRRWNRRRRRRGREEGDIKRTRRWNRRRRRQEEGESRERQLGRR